MGNISNPSVLESDDEEDKALIRIRKGNSSNKASNASSEPFKTIVPFGSDIINDQDLMEIDISNARLSTLYPYLTYDGLLNIINGKNDILAFIAYTISQYAAIKNSIHRTFEFKVPIKSSNTNIIPPDIFTNMLCGCSWNGIIYLINPINCNTLNGTVYTIDGGYDGLKSQQRIVSEIATSTISFDPNLCCIISHIIDDKNNENEDEVQFDRKYSIIIDGIIVCNSSLDTVYGYSMIKGLYKIKQFVKMDNDDIERNEVIINLWRQNIDGFILTSKFNLFGVRITQKRFEMEKICTFNGAVEDIGHIQDFVDYVDCWYDINTKSLFLIYKDIDKKSVYFKVYKSDRSIDDARNEENNQNNNDDDDDDVDDEDMEDLGIGCIEVQYETPGGDGGDDEKMRYNMVITKELQQHLDNYYFLSEKSFLFYHKISKCLLLIFVGYIVEIRIDFKTKQLITVNIGKIGNVNDDEMEIKSDDEGLEIVVCDTIIGYDEFRSCLILNCKECTKELSLLYKFKISVIKVMDFASDWKQII